MSLEVGFQSSKFTKCLTATAAVSTATAVAASAVSFHNNVLDKNIAIVIFLLPYL